MLISDKTEPVPCRPLCTWLRRLQASDLLHVLSFKIAPLGLSHVYLLHICAQFSLYTERSAKHDWLCVRDRVFIICSMLQARTTSASGSEWTAERCLSHAAPVMRHSLLFKGLLGEVRGLSFLLREGSQSQGEHGLLLASPL